MIAGGLALVIVGLAYQLFTPKSYQAKARIQFGGGSTANSPGGRVAAGSRGPSLSSEYQFFGSPEALDAVVENLHLRETWANRPEGDGKSLTPEAARLLLRAKTRVEIIDFLRMIEITVESGDRIETARIANELAHLYWNRRQEEKQKIAEGQINNVSEELKPLWDEATAKARAAQERLNAVTESIRNARANSTEKVYDAASLSALQSQRIRLEGEYVGARDMQAQLKSFSPVQLREVLPTILTNILLDKSLEALGRARSELREVAATKGANSSEVANATSVVAELNQRVDLIISGIMAGRDSDVAARKSALDSAMERLAHARTTLIASLSTNNSDYQAALADLQEATRQRDMITNRLSMNPAAKTMAENMGVVDDASVPTKPVSPDENLSSGLMVLGGVSLFGGVALWGLSGGLRPRGAPPGRSGPIIPSHRRN